MHIKGLLGETPIRLVLSGGGFRATLFHLGVIRFLLEAGLLKRIQDVYSVSGGSILSAHWAVNWQRYSSTTSFDSAAQELIAFVQSDVRGMILRRWLAFWLWVLASLLVTITFLYGTAGFTTLQWESIAAIIVACIIAAVVLIVRRRFVMVNLFVRYLDGFLSQRTASNWRKNRAELRDLRYKSNGDSSPTFHILATDLTTGAPWAFFDQGFQRLNEGKWHFFDHSLIPLAKAVASSAAFPPMFSPVRFTRRSLDPNLFPTDHYLADGGVYDNLGVVAARSIPAALTSESRLLISSAERCFENSTAQSFALLPSRASRSTDILMTRMSELNAEDAAGVAILLKTDDPNLTVIPVALQRLVRNIRTDLDRFSAAEIQLLVLKGYLSAWSTLCDDPVPNEAFDQNDSGVPIRCTDSHWLPIAESDIPSDLKAEATLTESDRPRFGLLSRRDWVPSMLLMLASLVVVVGNPLSVHSMNWLWNTLPGTPPSIEGTWYSLGTLPDEVLNETWTMPLLRPTNLMIPVAAAAFVGEPLGSCYGIRPRGEFDFSVGIKDDSATFVSAYAFLKTDDGKFEYLRARAEGPGLFSATVPPGRGDCKLCLLVVVMRDDGTIVPDAALHQSLVITVRRG